MLISLVLPAPTQAARWRPPETLFAPNVWIRIFGNGRVELVVARSEMGQGVTTALPMLLAEELEIPLTHVELVMAPAGPPYVNRLIGEQVTAGSTSVRDAWMRLRAAGAVGRELMIQAAAIRWGVPQSECHAHAGRVEHADGERRLGYGELAALAASLPQPEAVFLKDPAQWTLIGTEQPRLDTPDKVAGRARFGLDVRVPGMLFASIERCPVFGGRLVRVDPHQAKITPGVIDVLTPSSGVASGVAVIATDTWSALRGRRVLKIQWQRGDNEGVDTERIRESLDRALDRPGAVARDQGNAVAAIEGASIRVESDYETPFQAHACMEPMNCTADVTSQRCIVHVPTQAQQGVEETVRRITGLPAERIVVHTTFLGGGFGRRVEQDFVAEAVELSKRLKRPVQLVWTREDDLRHDFYRPMTRNRMRAGIDDGGNLVAWHHRIAAPSILSRVRPEAVRGGIDPTAVAGAADLPYAIPNLRVEFRRVDTPVPVGFWRSVGHSQNTFVTECFIDELARAAGKAPLTLRRLLLAERPRLLSVLELAAHKSRWDRPLPEGQSRGIAVAEGFGSYVAQVAEISILGGEVRVHRVVCAIDCGRVVNPNTVRAQMQSGIVFGLTATLKGSVTIAEGGVVEGNFDRFPLLRADEMPIIDVHLVESDADPGGVGEAGTPPIAPAVANAVFAATGRPVRHLPIRIEDPPNGDSAS
jgi:isoquinoline 1-oxidoreductase beta subunit